MTLLLNTHSRSNLHVVKHERCHATVMRTRIPQLLLLSYLLGGCHYGGASKVKELPNIIFVMADDLGYGDVHYNGGTADTPNLDAMASGPNSIHLQRYYSGGPVCSPTRGTVLTGRNHNRYCVWNANAGNNCPDFLCPEKMPLPSSEITVAEVLKESGYRTAAFGKWHLGDMKPTWGGNKKWPVSHPGMHGFDTWWATERSAPSSGLNCACFNSTLCPLGHYTSTPPCTNYYTVDPETGLLVTYAQPVEEDDSHFLVKLLKFFLEEVVKTGDPFFVYLPLHTVHIRYLASMGYIKRYTMRGYDMNKTDYYGAISAMDDAIGEIRELLKVYTISNNTMLWFTSDNGPEVHTPGVTAGFRGHKRELYEGGIRVPGIIEWPAMIKSNRVSDYPVVSSDLLPTVYDLLGITPPTNRSIDGESVLSFICGEQTQRNKSIAWAFHIAGGDFNGSYNTAISGNRYKLYASYANGDIESASLFDLIEDPFETKDRSKEFPDVYSDMKEELERWRESVILSAREEVQCLGYSVEANCHGLCGSEPDFL